MTTRHRLGSALLTAFLTAAAAGCGSIAEVEPTPLRDVPTETPASTSTALYVATRDGASSIVRVDAANGTVAPLTKPLPNDFRADDFFAATTQGRFLVSGKTSAGRVQVYAGTAESWHLLADLDAGWYIARNSPSLELVALKGSDRVGRPIGGRVVSFEGHLLEDLGASLEPRYVGDEGFVAVEYQLEHVDDDVVRASRETQPWWVVRADGTRYRLATDRSPNDAALAVEGGFAIRKDGECAAFSWNAPEAPQTSYGCADVAPPLIFEGPTVYRASAGGRDRVADLPAVPDAVVAESDPDGVSVFVGLRDADHTQLVTFAAKDGARVTYEPGDGGGRDFGAVWTRATTHAGQACAIASRTGCRPEEWDGICQSNIVDIVCGDAHAVRSKRMERAFDADGKLLRGPEQFVTTGDVAFVVWVDAGALHRLNARTFEETGLESSWTFGVREGHVPSVFNRP